MWLVRTGLGFYDLYARDSRLPRHAAARVGAAGSVPVDPHRYRWLCTYWDAQILYPERFVVALVEDARALADEHGVEFALYTYHRIQLVRDRAEIRRTSDDGGEPVRSVQPAAIVNATGAWVDRTLAQLDVITRQLIGGTKGSHFLTFHRPLAEALGGQGVYAEAEDGRPVFILPWDQRHVGGHDRSALYRRSGGSGGHRRRVGLSGRRRPPVVPADRFDSSTTSTCITPVFGRCRKPAAPRRPRSRAGIGWKDTSAAACRCTRSSAGN